MPFLSVLSTINPASTLNKSPNIKGSADIQPTFAHEKPRSVFKYVGSQVSEVQLSKIAEGELDAGFLLFRPLNDPLFAGIPVFKEKMLLAYPTEWKWPDNKEPRYLRELQNLDFIWLPRTAAPAWHDRLIHCFYDAGFTPRSVMHGVDAVSMLTLVSAGMGCTIVAEGMRHLAPSNVSFVVLEDLNIVQEWELVWRKDRCSEVLKSLINLI